MHAGNRLQIVAFVLLLPALLCFAVAHRANAEELKKRVLLLDGVAVSVANGSPLGQFGSGPGMHVLGAYPSGGSGSSFFTILKNTEIRRFAQEYER